MFARHRSAMPAVHESTEFLAAIFCLLPSNNASIFNYFSSNNINDFKYGFLLYLNYFENPSLVRILAVLLKVKMNKYPVNNSQGSNSQGGSRDSSPLNKIY